MPLAERDSREERAAAEQIWRHFTQSNPFTRNWQPVPTGRHYVDLRQPPSQTPAGAEQSQVSFFLLSNLIERLSLDGGQWPVIARCALGTFKFKSQRELEGLLGGGRVDDLYLPAGR